jgi:hypothetical protein
MRISDPALLDFTYRTYVQEVIPERPYVRPGSIEAAVQVIFSGSDAIAPPIRELVDRSLI